MNDVVIQDENKEIILSPEIIKRYICPQATEQEIYLFFQLCKAQGLNPFLREAYLIKYGEEKASMVVGKETFTKRADKLPDCDGWEAGIIVLDNNKVVTYRNGALIVEGEVLLGGWANVYRKSRSHPYHIEVSLKEYQRYNKKGELTKAWREMGATMIRKVPLVQALREAYPQEFANMLSPEEMPVDTLPEYKMGQDIPPPTIPMPQRKSEVPKDENPFDGKDDGLTVKDVTEQKGKAKDVKMPDGTIKEGKPYTKYTITTSDGVIYNTFSDTLLKRAMEAMKTGAIVTVKGKESQYGHDLEDIAIMEKQPSINSESPWDKQAIINIITSSDSLDMLADNWKSLMPHIGKLSGPDKVECQKVHDETKRFIEEG